MKRNDDELATNIISEPGRELHYTCLDRDFAATRWRNCYIAQQQFFYRDVVLFIRFVLKKKGRYAPFLYLLYNTHFINQVAATAELVDDEENVADIYCDTTLEVVVEVDVTTQ